MQIQIGLPDDIVLSLQNKWGDLEPKILEILAIEAYRDGLISAGKVRELLGIRTRLEVDAFLKSRGIDLQYTEDDLEKDRQTHEQLREIKTL